MSKKIKVLLIESSSFMEMGIPPNIAILVSALKKSDVEVKIFSTNFYKFNDKETGDDVRVKTLQVPPVDNKILPEKTNIIDDFQFLLKNYKPDIVGLSCTEPTFLIGLKLLQSIEDKNILKIAGGAYPTLCPEETISHASIDGICIGEGEYPLVELCKSLKNKKINNFWFKVDSEIIKNPLNPLCNVNEIFFQDWSPWDVPPRTMKPMAGKINATALVELSRGCPFNCAYCANSFLNKKFRDNYRERKVDRFIEEIECIGKQYNLGFIYISDETILTTSNTRFLEFTNKYPQIGLPFWCETRPEFIKSEKIKKLKDVGLQVINVGIESGNFDFRKKLLNRSVSDDKIINGIKEATEADVRVGANVIIGFPGETRDHIFETIDLVRESKPTSTMVHLFQPYVKTPLREECIKRKIINKDYICGDYRIDAIGTGFLLAEELLGLQRTFNLYVDFPKNEWDTIREAECFNNRGNKIFYRLAREYQLKHFGYTCFNVKK